MELAEFCAGAQEGNSHQYSCRIKHSLKRLRISDQLLSGAAPDLSDLKKDSKSTERQMRRAMASLESLQNNQAPS